MQKVLYRDQIQDYSEYLNAGMIDYIGRGLTEAFEGFDDCDLMAFQWYDVNSKNTAVSQIMVYIDREDLFFFCADHRSFEKCSSLLVEEKVSNERALYLFFVGLLSKDARRLQEFETVITNTEDAAIQNSRADYLNSIREFRKELLRLKRYYEELETITDNLAANDNELFTDDGVTHFAVVHNRVSHFCTNVMSLRDYVTQMREACQSQISMEQNRLMRVCTVVATIFLPLTLIVGWYGMNFEYMPEVGWRYGYLFVIILSAAVLVILLIWCKRRKWF